MSATDVIEEIKALPREEKGRLWAWLATEFDDIDAFFAWCDSVPKRVEMTEEEILALPRMIPPSDRLVR